MQIRQMDMVKKSTTLLHILIYRTTLEQAHQATLVDLK